MDQLKLLRIVVQGILTQIGMPAPKMRIDHIHSEMPGNPLGLVIDGSRYHVRMEGDPAEMVIHRLWHGMQRNDFVTRGAATYVACSPIVMTVARWLVMRLVEEQVERIVFPSGDSR